VNDITIPQSWATSRVQICDFCHARMRSGKENYHCPKCGNARQKALIRWLRAQRRRA
jgi:tRNA(Ile2) C34 agmatinyltransferase TiaS